MKIMLSGIKNFYFFHIENGPEIQIKVNNNFLGMKSLDKCVTVSEKSAVALILAHTYVLFFGFILFFLF